MSSRATAALSDAAYAAGWAVVRALPEPVAHALFRAGADLAARRPGRGTRQLRRNLARVAPGRDLVRPALRSYARYWCEVFRLQVTPRERLLAGTTTTGEERFRAAAARPTGTVLALPHTGNWDAAGAWMGASGFPFTTVAERLQPESLYERFVAFRQSLGMEVLALTGGPRPPYEVLVERLEAGGTLCLLADRDLSVRGVDVDFFGEPARMPAGPASLALQTGATLLPVTLSFTDRGWHVRWHEEVPHTDVRTMTQALADAFAVGIAAHPADWHMLQRLWLADLPADDPPPGPYVKIGLVCPYTWDVPGGVQAHVRDLAEALLRLGHEVSVLAPVDDPDAPGLEPYVVTGGRAVPVPYNGSVARLSFGPMSLARTRRWLRAGRFDVLHIHEPTVPSVSMLAMWTAQGALVATFHTSTPRSRALQVFGTVLQPGLEKLTGRIAVSPAARRVIMGHLGGDAVLVPNGVEVAHFAGAQPLPGRGDAPTVLFLGRVDEDRKGLAVLLEALPELVRRIPDVRLLVAGPGDAGLVRERVPAGLVDRVELLGFVPEADKARVYASGTVYCAPNTHGESFGIVLLEAMATGTPVVASDLEAFRLVLDDGRNGVLFPVRDAAALAGALADLLEDPARRAALAERGCSAVLPYDWSAVTRQIVAVYEAAYAASPGVAADDEPDDVAGSDDDPSALRRLLLQLRSRP